MTVPCIALAMLAGTSASLAMSDDAFQPYVEIPGVKEFSSRMIVRPLQVEAWVERGVAAAEASERIEAARVAVSAYQLWNYVPETDEYIIVVAPGTENAVAATLMGTGNFQYAEPDWLVWPTACPNDARFGQQWHHAANRINSCSAWDIHTGTNSGVIIGYCDTGVRRTHEDLNDFRQLAYNAVDQLWENNGGQVDDINNHGTWVTGCGSGEGNNTTGIAGMGWRLGHRMLRVSNSSGGGSSLSILQHAARTSADAGDEVTSVSYSGVDANSNLTAATYVKSKGGILFWAAGNENRNLTLGNRDADDLMVIGGTDQADNKASFSNFGVFVDCVAPAVGIWTTDRASNSAYAAPDGTSFACPLAAGLAGLLKSFNGGLTHDQIEAAIKNGCDDLGANGVDNTFGYGRIDARRSLELVGGGTFNGPKGSYYLSSGNSRKGYEVKGTTLVRSWDHTADSGYTSAIEAFDGSIRLLGLNNGEKSAGYSLTGADNGARYTNSAPGGNYGDATTDGTFHYSIQYSTGDVYRFNRDWTGAVKIFNVPGSTVVGITYNPADSSFWFCEFGGTKVYKYSKTGTKLGEFDSGRNAMVALAMDYSDTGSPLWLLDRDTFEYCKYSQAGALLERGTYAGLANINNLGGEFLLPGGGGNCDFQENFPDPLGGWTGRALYLNSNMGNYYVAAGNCDQNNRGNNPAGLWIVDTQACGAGVGGATCDIRFSSGFGNTVTSLKFGVEAFVRQDITIYDRNGNVSAQLIGVSGGGFDFDHVDVINAANTNGVSRILFDSRPYGGSQIEGNTSVDNFCFGISQTCYADCDGNGRLDIRDFFCFQSKFAARDAYADCDGNRLFDIRDFFCFQSKYASGCP